VKGDLRRIVVIFLLHLVLLCPLSAQGWSDGFETYTAGSFPSMWSPDANASDSRSNYVSSTVYHGGTKSLQLYGIVGGCWAAVAYRPLTISPPYEVEVTIRTGNDSLSGCHPNRALIGVRKGFTWTNPEREIVRFDGNGNIKSSAGNVLQTYATSTWYGIRIRYERPSSDQVRISYWINEVYKGVEILTADAEEDQFTNFEFNVDEGTAWLDDVVIRSDSSLVRPTVATSAAGQVTSSSATLNGSVNPNGVETSAWFDWGTSSALLSYDSTLSKSIGSGSSAVSISETLTGLSPATTYYYRAVAQDSVGTQADSILSFRTSTIPPTVATAAAASVTSSSATLNGSVNPNGSSTTAWFEWGTSGTLETYSSTAAQSIGSGASAVSDSASLTGLGLDTTYYYRVVGQNSAGIERGYILDFTTTVNLPTVTTTAATSITLISATLNGSVNPNGVATNAWFEWGTNSALFSYDSTPSKPIGSASSAVSIVETLTGLDPATTYYCRAVAQNSEGTQRGSIFDFMTRIATPTLALPANGAVDVETSVVLTWNPSHGATEYHLQLSTGRNFALLIVDDSTLISPWRQVRALANNTMYYWRVSASRPGGKSDFTPQPFSFKTTSTLAFSNTTVQNFPANPTASTDYRLVSFPGTTGFLVNQILTGSQKTDWRIFAETGGPSDSHLRELTTGDSLNTGKGYWLLEKGPLSFSQNVTMPQLDTFGLSSVAIDTGWNIVGDPFDQAVRWSGVRAENGSNLEALWNYSGASGFQQDTLLQPFQAYYFYNGSQLQSLRIPYPFQGLQIPSSKVLPLDWKVQLIYQSDTNIDAQNYIGVSRNVEEGLGKPNEHKPPTFGDQGFLYFYRPELDSRNAIFSTDFRGSLGDGQVWNFEVHDPKLSRAKIRILGFDQVPNDYDIVLINLQNSVRVNVRERNDYEYQTVSDKMLFKVIIGKKAFAEGELEKVFPKKFQLEQNYPNPFNPSTSISFSVPTQARARVEILSILGQRLATLGEGQYSPGVYTLFWDATNQGSGGVASGVYFYRLIVDGKPLQTRKMLLLR
jgi:hypothetical protein